MKQFERPIFVTRPYLPPLEDFKHGLEKVWGNQGLTNFFKHVEQCLQMDLLRHLDVSESDSTLVNIGMLVLNLVFVLNGFSCREVPITLFRRGKIVSDEDRPLKAFSHQIHGSRCLFYKRIEEA